MRRASFKCETPRLELAPIVILAGALFYATVTFSFFLVFLWCPKVLYLKVYIIYHTSEVHTSLQKRGVSPPQNEDHAELHPPHFYYRSHPPCAWWCVSGAQGEH